MKKLLLSLSMLALVAGSGQGAVLITQYYEGSSFNKWIEITNTGAAAVDLGTGQYNLSLWSNANTEAYKTNGTPSASFALSGSLAAGSSFLYSHASATSPAYAVLAATATNNSVINFNGDDSVTLWTGAAFTTAAIIDAIGFTDLGAEGTDNSFVRLNTNQGWNTTAGSTVDDFASVWGEFTNAAVDSAALGTEQRLGFSSVAIPEPSAALLGVLGVLALFRRRR